MGGFVNVPSNTPGDGQIVIITLQALIEPIKNELKKLKFL